MRGVACIKDLPLLIMLLCTEAKLANFQMGMQLYVYHGCYLSSLLAMVNDFFYFNTKQSLG